jgi:hypothetical protein
MRTINPRLRGVTTNTRQSRRRPRAQLIADGVVASYIHDISSRHHDQDASQHDVDFRQPRIRRVRGAEQSLRNRMPAPRLDAA